MPPLNNSKKNCLALLMLTFAICVNNDALAQTDVAEKVVPTIMLLLNDEPNTQTTDIGEWQGVEIAAIANEVNQRQDDPQVVMDEAGNGWITWVQADGTNPNINSIWVNNYNSETGWGVAEKIETFDYEAETPTIAMNSSGNVIVVWGYEVPVQNSGGVWQIWGSHIDSDNNTWNEPILIVSGDIGDFGGRPRNPQLAMDENGNALLIWRESTMLISSYYNPATNLWGVSTEFSATSLTSTAPKLVMNASGQAMAIWRENITFLGASGFGETRPIIKGRIFNSGWGAEEAISFANDSSAIDGSITAQVAIDASGNAIVVWSHNKSLSNTKSETNVWARRYSISNGWESSALLETNDFKFAITPQVAINDSGNAIVIWVHKSEDLSSGLKSIWVNRFSSNNGWAGAQEIEPFSIWQNTIPLPQIGLDADGNAMAVWLHRQNGVNDVEAIRYDQVANTWGTLELIGSETGATSDPQLATTSLGRVLAIWNTDNFDSYILKSNYFK